MKKQKLLINRILKILNDGEYEVKLANLKYSLGDCDTHHNVIRISPFPKKQKWYKNMPLSPAATLIHEVLHIIFPKLTELAIERLTQKLWKNLQLHHKLALYEYIFE